MSRGRTSAEFQCPASASLAGRREGQGGTGREEEEEEEENKEEETKKKTGGNEEEAEEQETKRTKETFCARKR